MKKLFLFFAFAGLVCLCLWVGFGGIFALNFAFAILSFMLIVSIVFYTQKRKIQNLIQNASQEELEALSEAYKSKQEKLQEEEEEFWEESQNLSKVVQDIPSPLEIRNQSNEAQNLQEKSQNQQMVKENLKESQPKKASFWQNFSVQNTKTGAKIFFYPLRLFAYGFLVIGILLLISHQIFHSLAFFAGLIFANILVVLFLFMRD